VFFIDFILAKSVRTFATSMLSCCVAGNRDTQDTEREKRESEIKKERK